MNKIYPYIALEIYVPFQLLRVQHDSNATYPCSGKINLHDSEISWTLEKTWHEENGKQFITENTTLSIKYIVYGVIPSHISKDIFQHHVIQHYSDNITAILQTGLYNALCHWNKLLTLNLGSWIQHWQLGAFCDANHQCMYWELVRNHTLAFTGWMSKKDAQVMKEFYF